MADPKILAFLAAWRFLDKRDACNAPLGPRGRAWARTLGVAPSMGRKKKVRVLLEPRQTESNIEDKGVLARGRLVEVLDAVRNRAKAKHRKALVSWVSRPPAAKPNICWSTGCIGDGIRANFSAPYLGRSAGLRGNTVAPENARTRR
jgi:hypothetical protein